MPERAGNSGKLRRPGRRSMCSAQSDGTRHKTLLLLAGRFRLGSFPFSHVVDELYERGSRITLRPVELSSDEHAIGELLHDQLLLVLGQVGDERANLPQRKVCPLCRARLAVVLSTAATE